MPESEEFITFPFLDDNAEKELRESSKEVDRQSYLAYIRFVGREAVRFRDEVHRLDQEVYDLRAELNEKGDVIWRLLHDEVVEPFLSRRGLDETIRQRELSEELQQGRCGVIFMDVRFLKFINDTLSYEHGDAFLIAASRKMEEVLDSLVRTNSRPVETDHRQMSLGQPDIRVRYGGDEFIILIRNISPEDLEAVVERLAGEFSIEKAQADSEENSAIPVAANVAGVHAANLSDLTRDKMTPKEIFKALVALSNEPANAVKKVQYTSMWRAIVDKTGASYDSRPDDDRDVAKLFIKHCCPHFDANASRVIIESSYL